MGGGERGAGSAGLGLGDEVSGLPGWGVGSGETSERVRVEVGNGAPGGSREPGSRVGGSESLGLRVERCALFLWLFAFMVCGA